MNAFVWEWVALAQEWVRKFRRDVEGADLQWIEPVIDTTSPTTKIRFDHLRGSLLIISDDLYMSRTSVQSGWRTIEYACAHYLPDAVDMYRRWLADMPKEAA